MNHHQDTNALIEDIAVSRRGIFRAGGITIGLAALLAACVEDAEDSKPARVGEAPDPVPLPEPVFSDGVLFRTAASLHFSIIDAHNNSKELGDLTAEQAAIVDEFIARNTEAIAALETLTETAGSKPWTCANPRFNRVVVDVLKDRITGRPAEGNKEAIAPSDDPNRDALAMAYAMESVAAATHQSYVPKFSKPEYRAASMLLGQDSARRSAALALAINPANTVNPLLIVNATLEDPPTTAVAETATTVQNIAQDDTTASTEPAAAVVAVAQVYYAVPSLFGILSPFQLAIGAPIAGSQFTLNIETPSINSYVYDYQDEC